MTFTIWNVLLGALIGVLIGHLAARYFFEAIFERGNSSAFDNFHNFDERIEILKEYKAALEAQTLAHKEYDDAIERLEENGVFIEDSVCDKMSEADCVVKRLEGALVRGTKKRMV